MKLKLVATIKKEALLPGMEQAVQDINLQKELNKPGVVQQVNMSDQTAINQLKAKYPRKGDWNAGDLEKDIKSYMEKFHAGKPYGIGVAGPNDLNDKMQAGISFLPMLLQTSTYWYIKSRQVSKTREVYL